MLPQVPRRVLLLLQGLAVSVLVIDGSPKDTSTERRGADAEGPTFITTDINGLGDAVYTYMTGGLETSRKRTYDNRTLTWNYKIPLIFDASYGDPFYRNVVMRVVRFLNSKTCITMTDETSRWNSSNPYWFTQNGYTCNCYISVITGTGCNTRLGSGPVNGSVVKESVCKDSNIIMHELFHAFGIQHEQQAFIAPSYISTFYSSVSADLLYTYDYSSPFISATLWDPSTTELYSSDTWSSMQDDTYQFNRPDQGQLDGVTSSENVLLEHLNVRYNCSAKFCPGNLIDCGPGYLAYIDNVCKCVCPSEYNSTTNCKTFINQADSSLSWPLPMSFFAAGNNFACPPGFQVAGWFSFCGIWANPQGVSPGAFYPSSGTTTHYPVCSKTSPTTNVDWNSLPMGGRYCFIKPLGVDCGGILTQATVQMQSQCAPQHNGSVGDITFDAVSKNVTMNLCCSNFDRTDFETVLPNAVPFRLFTIYSCPSVKGMRTYKNSLSFYTKKASNTGVATPLAWIWSSEVQLNLCYYQPAVYGCSQNITLTAKTKTVTVKTPGYPGPRPADTRCFYCFNAPSGSQLRVTFNDYDLEIDDKMRIKRYHKWSPPYRLVNDNPWKQFVTESNYLCMEFWTSYKTNVTNRGASFTVDLLLPSDSCYDTSQNGLTYLGTTNVSETYEPCLTWKEALNCHDFSVSAQDALTGYFENNYCRNPGGKLLQPWCYAYRNGTSCVKRYCDVCNTKAPVDWLKTSYCTSFISQDASFCQKSFTRFLCFKSCGMTQAPTGSPGTCSSPPPVPSDGSLVGSAKTSYHTGDRAYVQCTKTLQSDSSTKLILCTRNGWKGPLSACLDCPPGYTIYGDRCIYFTTSLATRPAALAFCNSLGRNGTLMYARNQTDADLMSSIRNKADSKNDHTWLGIYLCNSAKATWCFLGTSTPITFSNWNGGSTPTNPKYDVAYMYRESSTSGRNTKYVALSSNDTTSQFTYFCQIDRTYSPVTDDKYSRCQDVLADYPSFCKNQDTKVDSAIFCAKSCGLSSATPKCSEPTSSTYTRVSGTGPVTTGDYMTFQCKAGYFLTGGDTSRACGLSGVLLGTAPVCTKNPTSVDMGLSLVRDRQSQLPSNMVFVMDVDGYRVPISGNITTWYYYCDNPALLYFLVFRKSGSSYNIIGYNTVNCIPGYRMSFSVPKSNQTSVVAGDMVGAWTTTSYALSISKCDTAALKILNCPTASPGSASSLLSTTSYSSIKCIIPALGFRVET